MCWCIKGSDVKLSICSLGKSAASARMLLVRARVCVTCMCVSPVCVCRLPYGTLLTLAIALQVNLCLPSCRRSASTTHRRSASRTRRRLATHSRYPWWSATPCDFPWWSATPCDFPWWSATPCDFPWWSATPCDFPWWSATPCDFPWW